jgi:very-short-patch-repair endonuclease
MHSLSPAVSAWLAAHHGIASRSDLIRLGVTADQLRRLLRLRVLVPACRGIYRLTAAPTTALQPAAIACAVAPHVVVSHHSAGRIWGLRRLGPDRGLHVTIAGRVNRDVAADFVHRSHRIDPSDVVHRPDGIRLTSPVRTAFDLAAVRSDHAFLSIIEQLLHEERCSIPDLYEAGRRLRERGRNGSARFGRVLQSRPGFAKPVGSDLELRVEQAIVAAGLPRPERQHPITLPDGSIVHPDFFWPVEREALEIDHVTWHGGKLDLTYDKRRDRQLRRVGVHVTRVTDDDVRRDLPGIIADLAAILGRTRAA